MIATIRAIARSTALVALLASLIGCSTASGDALAGRTFLSVAITDPDGAARQLVPGTTLRLTFGTDGQLGATAGCNTMGATYRTDGSVLRIADAAMTEMACDEALMAQDDWLFGFLGSGPTVALAGADLTLSGGGTVVRLTDREVADPDRPLVGPIWTVDSLVGGDAVSSVPAGVVATLQFRDDGLVDVATGCNGGSGRYALDGATLRIEQLTLTKMACAGPAGQVEDAVLAVLGADRIAWSIDAARLTLDAGGVGLGLTTS